MLLIKNSGEYPLFVGDLKLEHTSWQDGDPLPSGWFVVEESDRPNIFAGQKYVEMQPENVNGIWKRVWAVENLTLEELEAMKIEDIAAAKPTL